MRDVWILTTSQAFAACGMIVMFAFGGIVGTRISPVPTLATLPLSAMVVGVALMTIPAALLMQRFGRKRAFILSALGGSGAALLAAWATAQSHFPGFCVACLLMGMTQSFVLQYRFAATEYVDAGAVGRAVGTVMVGTLIAAVLGPELGDRARLAGDWPEFTGSFLAMAVLMTLGAAILGGLRHAQPRAARSTAVARPTRQILTQPTF